MGPGTIMNVYPTDFHKRFPNTVPVPRASDDLDVSAGSPIPRHREAGALGSVRPDLVGEASFWPFTRGRPIVWRVRGGGGSYSAASP
jgi:hypothetical protein